jgi:hypothetical protein
MRSLVSVSSQRLAILTDFSSFPQSLQASAQTVTSVAMTISISLLMVILSFKAIKSMQLKKIIQLPKNQSILPFRD